MAFPKTFINKRLSPEQFFMLSVMMVNAGNYFYNLLLGRLLGPEGFSDAAILVTFLLVISFAAMTFQLTVAKFTVVFEKEKISNFLILLKKHGIGVGFLTGTIIVLMSSELQSVFNTRSSEMFTIFGIGVPLYFLMSINRGYYQGSKKFYRLSMTYQSEMLSRLGLTILFLYLLDINSSIIIAIGILISFVFGLIPFKSIGADAGNRIGLDKKDMKIILGFISITAFYEFTQIIINNSDILLVKHYFMAHDAGLYASLSLIGRVVYFVAWMFVMLLLPKVVQRKKDGEETYSVLLKYVGYVSLLAASIVLATYLMPNLIIQLMFGEAYLDMAPLLWKYAIATSVFAISNVFVYYFLSLDNYLPVVLSGIFGLCQIALIVVFHDTLEQVVNMQIITMFLLLIMVLAFFFYQHKSQLRLQ